MADGINQQDSSIIALVRDRTEGDVQRVIYLTKRHRAGTATEEETAEFIDPTLKGAYNATDMNRVGAAVYYLADRLATQAGETAEVVAKRDWTTADIPTIGETETYLNDVAAIRAEVEDILPETTPQVPDDMVAFTYTEANDIEQILWDVNEAITKIMFSWRYAGEIYAGEV